MATLAQAKTLGGIGWILTLLIFVPFYVGTALQIVGYVLVFMAVKYISDVTGNKKIYSDMVIGIALAIVGTVVFAGTAAFAILRFIGLGFGTTTTGPPPPDVFSLIGVILAGLLVVWVLAVVAAIFFRRSYTLISDSVGVKLFGTAALIYLIGAVLAIVLVGFLLIFVAQILFIVAFFSLPDQLPSQAMVAPSPSPPPPPPSAPIPPSSTP